VQACAAQVAPGHHAAPAPVRPASATTPIKHVVVIFGENISFDHYFGTYPNAANDDPGEPPFTAKPGTPSVNGLTPELLNDNPNTANPQRLSRAQAVTCSQNHSYGPEQLAMNATDGTAAMDGYVEHTAGGSCTDKSIVMDYYDGNTVTGLWNLAQNFSLNDNSFSTQFGPSTVGAINLISGNTHGVTPATGSGIENGTVIGDPDPSTSLDDCASGSAVMSGRNIGDLLNDKHVSWGWFEGGFRPSSFDASGKATCATSHVNVAGGQSNDYSPHHEPFEYYPSTSNKHHTPPTGTDEIGHDGPANHQYDLIDFDSALAAGTLPAVSFLKPAQFEDAHPGNSDPVDEQRFIARTLDALESSPEWSSTMVVIAYDDSDGWYYHQASPIVNPSRAPSDGLNGPGVCGTDDPAPDAYPDRCGYGPRQPLLVISPYAKQNYVDHTQTDQTSILKFIEDNWDLGRIGDQSMDAIAGPLTNMLDFDAPLAPKVFLDPTTGEVTRTEPVNTPPVQVPVPGPTTTVTQTVTTPPPPAQVVTPPAPTPAPTTGGSTTGSTTTRRPRASRPKVTCHTSGSRRAVKVACTAKGGRGTTRLRFRLVNHGKQVATSSTTVHSGKASATLRPRKALKPGSYQLAVTVSTSGLSPKVSRQTVHV